MNAKESASVHRSKRKPSKPRRSKRVFVRKKAMSASDLERRRADNLAEKVNRAIASGRQMHLDDDGWYVDDTTGELIGPDPRMERPLTEKDRARGDVYEGEKLIRRGGRPKSSDPKKLTALRLDSDLLAQLKSSGPGWQTRVNAMLRRAAKLDINLRIRMRGPIKSGSTRKGAVKSPGKGQEN
jgi:uncharacterized protein (DUF4415 family)